MSGLISILMPIYNGIEYINDSVQSVKTQTFTSWELLIGINGHPQDSDVYKEAKKFENEKIHVLDLWNLPKGKVPALYELLKSAQGDWIALLDVDDMWYPQKLESQIPYTNQGFDVIGTGCQYFGSSQDIPEIPLENISNFDFFKYNPMINSSVLLRKKLCLWENIVLEDYDLWLKLRNLKYNFYNVPKILVKHRIHSDSAFNSRGNHLHVSELLSKHSSKSIVIISLDT